MKNMNRMKHIFGLVLILCFVAVNFTSTVLAFGERSCCVVECICADCRCSNDCDCFSQCDCSVTLCSVCEAIVKQRETLEQQLGSVILAVTDVQYPLFNERTARESDELTICTANIVDACSRMNN
jgi:hypothetical protein